MKINVGDHWKAYLPVDLGHFSGVHLDTLITAWIAMGTAIILALIVTRNLNRVPGKIQLIAEKLMIFIDDISVSQMGKEGIKHTPLVGSLFLFILFGNLLGQVPLRLIHLPGGELCSPTNDLNTTVALALLVLVYYISSGIRKKGFKFFRHYFQPFWFLAPLNFLEDFTRPVSLSVRLFGNILAGEVIIGVLIAFLFLFPLLIPLTEGLIICLVMFELFVAVIQAFIFAVLSASYIAAATSNDH